MKILFTTNNKIGSRFIRWGTEGDCSHLALCFEEDDEGNGIVFHSNGAHGAHPVWLKDFLAVNTVVKALGFSPDISSDIEDKIFKKIVTDHAGEGYDFKALLFWFVMGGRKKMFGTSLPEKNEWAKAGYSLCTGLVAALQTTLPDYFWGPSVDWEMLSPADIFDLLVKRDGFYSCRDFVDQLAA